MNGRRRPWLRFGMETVAVIALHAILLRVLADGDTVAKVFALGRQVPAGTLVLIGFFAGVRVLAVFLLPAIIPARILWLALEQRTANRTKARATRA